MNSFLEVSISVLHFNTPPSPPHTHTVRKNPYKKNSFSVIFYRALDWISLTVDTTHFLDDDWSSRLFRKGRHGHEGLTQAPTVPLVLPMAVAPAESQQMASYFSSSKPTWIPITKIGTIGGQTTNWRSLNLF